MNKVNLTKNSDSLPLGRIINLNHRRARGVIPLEAGHLARLSRRELLDCVDLFLEEMDNAAARGDLETEVHARALWNRAWDELDKRDGLPVEASS